MLLSLAANPYYWTRQDTLDFYDSVKDSPLDIIYLGETVCAKRRELTTLDWIDLGRELALTGKQVVLSTLTLLEASSELKTLRTLCNNGEFLVEANDMAAVNLLSEAKLPFVAGAGINIYNLATLQLLQRLGLTRWVCPVELSKSALEPMLAFAQQQGIQSELLVFGRMALAYSARCFTARAHNMPKDQCQRKCLDYPDGLPLYSQEQQHFLHINGIQTQSGHIYNLLTAFDEIRQSGIAIARITPQKEAMPTIISTFDKARHGIATNELPLAGTAQDCNGFWYGQAGMQQPLSTP